MSVKKFFRSCYAVLIGKIEVVEDQCDRCSIELIRMTRFSSSLGEN